MAAPDELTVAIADDEELICDLIKNLIRWDEFNLRLLDEPGDGLELYEIIELNCPDIVITIFPCQISMDLT